MTHKIVSSLNHSIGKLLQQSHFSFFFKTNYPLFPSHSVFTAHISKRSIKILSSFNLNLPTSIPHTSSPQPIEWNTYSYPISYTPLSSQKSKKARTLSIENHSFLPEYVFSYLIHTQHNNTTVNPSLSTDDSNSSYKKPYLPADHPSPSIYSKIYNIRTSVLYHFSQILPVPSSNRRVTRLIKDYLALSKHKLSVWVAISTLPGLLLSPSINPSTFTYLFFGTLLSSASASCFNQIVEKNRDARMYRTRLRPIASGRISLPIAKSFGVITGVTGVYTLSMISPLPALLAASNIVLYACLYTPMKVKSPYNTHLGSIAGSLPVLIGCAAAGHSILSAESLLLFSLQTLWQFPHFYALAWLHKEDYKRAGFTMFPLSDDTGHDTAARCKRYLIALTLLPWLSSYMGVTSWMFAFDSLIPNLVTLSFLNKFHDDPTKQNIRKFFILQLWQLFCILVLAVYHCKSMLYRKRFPSIYENLEDIDQDIKANKSNPDTFSIDNIRSYLTTNCPHILFGDLISAQTLKKTEKITSDN